MNKFAPHFQRFSAEMRDLIARWQPPFVVWVDPNQEGVNEIRHVSPVTFIVGRKNEKGHDWRPVLLQRISARFRSFLMPRSLEVYEWNYQTSPEWWADECAIMAQCDAFLYNEPISHDETHLFAAFDEWQTRFRTRLLKYNIEAVAFNFGTGNFTKDGPDIRASFPNSCDFFQYFGDHEYDWIIDPARRPVDLDRLGYYWNRWPHWLNSIGRDDVTLWITECGMTQAVHEGRPDEGWRSGADGMTDEDYIAWADWYNGELVRDDRIGGAALFNFAGYGWETFEHLGWERLDEILALDAEPPEENGGEMNEIRVFDMDNVERDLDWAVGKYGVALRRYPQAVGKQVYRLVELREKSGPASLITKVLGPDGNPIENMDVAFYWPDAPDPPDPPTELLEHDWYGNFKHGPTNENGDVGPGMGTGAYHGVGEGGPHAVWVRDMYAPSDICEKLGMLAGTFHDHLDQVLQLTVQGEEPQPPPQGDLAEELATIGQSMIEDGQRVQEIAGLVGNGFAPSKMTLESGDGRTATYTLTEIG